MHHEDETSNMNKFLCFAAVVLWATRSLAHDAWVETHTSIVRTGDAAHISLLLGNHGNSHRDFKLAGKVDLRHAQCELIRPDGNKLDLKPTLFDVGYAPAEGYWSTRFVAAEPGLYTVNHLSDQVMSYAPVRSIKGAKAYFVVSDSLDRVSRKYGGFERPLEHPLELIPTAHPITPMGVGVPIRVRLVYRGKPLAGARVSFIPRSVSLSDGFDATYERTTDDRGEAAFTPTLGTQHLVVAHHEEPNERGEGFDRTKYSATLTIFVPQICPCCQE